MFYIIPALLKLASLHFKVELARMNSHILRPPQLTQKAQLSASAIKEYLVTYVTEV
jgi:hypothetical protein